MAWWDGPDVKLRRAGIHLHALWNEIEVFLNAKPYGVSAQLDDEGWERGIFHVRRMPPVELSAIAGDAAHNLRSALDQSVYQLSRARERERRRTSFPFYTNEREYLEPRGPEETIARETALAGVPDEYRAVIDAAQPFHRPELNPLALLAAFDNADKHRLVHPAFVRQVRQPVVRVVDGSLTDIEVRYGALHKRLSEDAEVFAWRPVRGKEDVHVQIDSLFTVGFGEGAVTAPDLQIIEGRVIEVIFALKRARL